MRSVKTKVIKKKNVSKKASKVVKAVKPAQKVVQKKAAKSHLPKLGKKIAVKTIKSQPVAEKKTAIKEVAPLAMSLSEVEAVAAALDSVDFGDFKDVDFDEDFGQAEEEPPIVIKEEPVDVEVIEVDEEGRILNLRQKKVIMYTAIISIMVMIVGFWIFGIRNSLGQSNFNDTGSDQSTDKVRQALQAFTDSLSGATSAVGQTIKNPQQSFEASTSRLKQKLIEEQMKNDLADQMQEKLENLQFETK